MGLHSNITILLILALVLELNNHRCELCWLYLFAEINWKKKDQLTAEIALHVGRYKSTRIDEGRSMLNYSRDRN